MRRPELKIKRARGFLLIVAIFVLVVVAVAIAAMANMTSADIRSSSGHAQSEQAYFAATSGIEYAKSLFLTGTACGAGLNATAALGNGSFTVSNATQYTPTPTSTAAGGVTAIATTIPVLSTAGYAPYGRIVIDAEEMYYAGISGNDFINVVRGYGNTMAAAHGTVSAALVLQSSCSIESTGTVGNAKRKLTANMPLQFYNAGVITKKSTAGAGAVAYTGIGFKPTVVIFFWTEQTTTGAWTGNNAGVSSGIGFAAATGTTITNYAAVTGMEDNTGRSSNRRRRSTGNAVIFQTVTAAPTLLAQANLQSMDADGFTLNWTTNGNANAYRINYIALGGDTQGIVGNFNMNNATGNQSITGAGFQPGFVLFIHAADGALDADVTDAELGIGFAQSATARGTLVYAGESNVNVNIRPRWQQLTDKAILFLDHAATPPTAAGQADFVSMDSNGFTIDVTTASGGATWNVGYLALRGVRVNTGAFDEPGATGSQTPVSNLPFKPKGVMLASSSLASGAALAAGRTAIGAGGGSPIDEASIGFYEESGVSTSDVNSYNDAANIISMGANNSSTNPAQASLQSLDLGGFTLNWGARNATREILYWAVGPRNHADVNEVSP